MCSGAVSYPTPAAPRMQSSSNLSALSFIPSRACVLVNAPLIPDVAFVLFPPKNEHLSSKTTRPPRSRTVCAADKPARPPPITMTCSLISLCACACDDGECGAAIVVVPSYVDCGAEKSLKKGTRLPARGVFVRSRSMGRVCVSGGVLCYATTHMRAWCD